jgi:hypothetical protein
LLRKWLPEIQDLIKLSSLSQSLFDLIEAGIKLHFINIFLSHATDATFFQQCPNLIETNFFLEIMWKYHNDFFCKSRKRLGVNVCVLAVWLWILAFIFAVRLKGAC